MSSTCIHNSYNSNHYLLLTMSNSKTRRVSKPHLPGLCVRPPTSSQPCWSKPVLIVMNGDCQSGEERSSVLTSAANRSIGSTTGCTITEKAPTRAFSWLKAATTAFTFKTLLRHYPKQALTPRSLNVKLGPQRNYHEGRAAA